MRGTAEVHHPGDERAGDGGRLLAGRYRVIRQLGRGGMGVVCSAYDEVLGREVAVKELRTYADAAGPELADLRVRMQREARAAARVRHTGVIAVHDIADHEGRPVIVMELVDGPSLDDVLRDEGTLEPARVAAIGAKVLDALAAAHRVGVLHRDVKPGNILLERGGRVVLTDFGIAAVEDPGDGASANLTRSGELVGSLDYLAPERARGEDPGPASDVWALGATLYAAVEGGSPFRRTSTWSTLTAIVAEPLPEPRHAGPLGPALHALLEKDPGRRADAAQAAELLRQVAEGGAPTGPAAGGGAADTVQLGAVRGPRQGPAQPPAVHPPRPGHPGQAPPHAQGTAGGTGAAGAFPAAGQAYGGGDRDTDRSTLQTRSTEGARGRRTAVAAAVAAVLLAGAGVAWAVTATAPDGKERAAAAGESTRGKAPNESGSAEPRAGRGTGKPKEGLSSPDASGSASESAAPAGGEDGGDGDDSVGGGGEGTAGGSGSGGGGDSGSGGGDGDDGSGGSGSGGDAGGGSGGGAAGGGTGGGSQPEPSCHPIGGGKYNCEVWRTADSYNSQHQKVGTLYSGTNYFFCQAQKPHRETYGQWTNVWWAKTDDDSGNPGVWVSVVYIRGGGNEQPVPGLPTC